MLLVLVQRDYQRSPAANRQLSGHIATHSLLRVSTPFGKLKHRATQTTSARAFSAPAYPSRSNSIGIRGRSAGGIG
jgi:hypothetical protein